MAGRRILLINPNSLEATTAMMVAIAKSAAADGFDIAGTTATRAPTMIVSGMNWRQQRRRSRRSRVPAAASATA